MRENLSSEVCEQQRRRPACASAQTDQCLCYSLIRKYHVCTCYERNFNFLASLCSWGDWFETGFVGNPEDRFSHNEAHIICFTRLPKHKEVRQPLSKLPIYGRRVWEETLLWNFSTSLVYWRQPLIMQQRTGRFILIFKWIIIQDFFNMILLSTLPDKAGENHVLVHIYKCILKSQNSHVN